MSGANYNGRQPDNTAYIKTFVEGSIANPWTVVDFSRNNKISAFLTPNENTPNVFINGDLFVNGRIINTYPSNLNENNIQETLKTLLNLINNMQKQIDELKGDDKKIK